MMRIIDYLIDNNIAKESIVLLLMLPIITGVIMLIRQLTGVKAFGIYTPLIISLSFIETSLTYGLIIFSVVFVTALAMRYLLKHFRLMYLPRMAIVITVVSYIVLFTLCLTVWKGSDLFAEVSIFPVLIMISLSEKYVDVQIKKGDKEAIKNSVETIIIAIICFLIYQIDWLTNFVFYHAYVPLIIIPLSILFGKYSGLRFPEEFWRFRSIWNKK